MRAKGFANDALTSIKCPFGYRVTLYSDDNFRGDMKIITSDTSTVGLEWNDRVEGWSTEWSGNVNQWDYYGQANQLWKKNYDPKHDIWNRKRFEELFYSGILVSIYVCTSVLNKKME